MLQSILFFAIVSLIYGTIEYYGWQAVRTVVSTEHISMAKMFYWGISVALLLMFLSYRPFLYKYMPKQLGTYLSVVFVGLLLSKLVVLLFLLPEDFTRFVKYLSAKFTAPDNSNTNAITRSEFLSKAALLAAAVPAGTLIYGVVANAYNYQFRKTTIRLPNLPAAFNGFKIVQLSDIHSGSFTQTQPIIEVIEKINKLQPDVILFTGDLVNNVADEMDSFISIFKNLKAKHGVFSITGNHDYGDYVPWDTPEAKIANFEKFKGIHKAMGWDLLLNEHRLLERGNDKIALLGIENWGGGRFAKYGKLDEAYKGTNDIPFKILMSHDPSHWNAQVTIGYNDIDLTLSGHTHGAQFGIENKWLKWSPSKYIYKQWAGLYNEGKQFLYVNRGFGFLGYPGRVGILPEVAVLTLEKA